MMEKQSSTEIKSPYLTETQAAEYLNVAPGTLRKWRHRRRGPDYHRAGYFIRYKMEDLTSFIEGSKVCING